MSFTKTTFVNGSTPPLNDTNLNNISDQIEFLSNVSAVTTNSDDNYSLTLTNSRYNLDVGVILSFVSNYTNEGGSTLNVNSLGAKDIKKEVEGSLIDLFFGDITVNRTYLVVYDGTQFILLNPSRRDMYYETTTHSNNDYSISLVNELIYLWEIYNGLTVRIKSNYTNTGSATLNINSLGAKNIKKVTRSGVVDLVAGDIQLDGVYTLIYDGTNFQLQNPTVPVGATGYIDGDGTSDRFISLGFTPKIVFIWTDRSTYKVMSITLYSGATYGLQLDSKPSIGNITSISNNTAGAEIVSGGFRIGTYGEYNINGVRMYYTAF